MMNAARRAPVISGIFLILITYKKLELSLGEQINGRKSRK